MPYIPLPVRETELSRKIAAAGLHRSHQGKVRDSYSLDEPGLRLIVTTDRISTDDIVWSVLIPGKGKVLNNMSAFWFNGPLSGTPNHFVATGADVDEHLPGALRGDEDLHSRSMIVKEYHTVQPFEAVVRNYLTGSGWRTYRDEHKMPCDHPFINGLYDGIRLPRPLFTPTTKSDVHDQPIPIDQFRRQFGATAERLSLDVFKIASKHAERRRIIIADTKMEWAVVNGALILVDEVFTPDSSRFWRFAAWQEAEAEKRSPAGMDKEKMRVVGRDIPTPAGKGLGSLDLIDPVHQKWMDEEMAAHVPQDSIAETSATYEEIGQLIMS